LKPAVKTRPSTGWTIQPKQPINKTIGINKLGTLLSSQTTDTPGTTTTKHGRGSLRSNFPNLPGFGSRCKSCSQDHHQRTTDPANIRQRTKRRPEPGLKIFGIGRRGSQRFRWSPSRRLRKQYTRMACNANPPGYHSPCQPERPPIRVKDAHLSPRPARVPSSGDV
jgi:hypothetical protein